MRLMSEGKRGEARNGEERHLLVSHPLFFYSLIVIIFFVLIFLFFSASTDKIELSETSPIFENKEIFSHLLKTEYISYTIRSRESLDRNNIHRVYFKIEVPRGVNQEYLSAVAQKVVKETIIHERCHSIKIDFGPYGYVDFAPFGDWNKAGEININGYRNYRFNYVFSSLMASK